MRGVLEQFVRFALVGVAGTAAHYTVLWTLVERAGTAVVVATSAGFVVGALVNYTLNRYFTFSSTAPHREALPKFFGIAVVGAFLNGTIVAWLLPRWHVHYLVIQLFATVAVLLWNFVANSLWTFKKTFR